MIPKCQLWGESCTRAYGLVGCKKARVCVSGVYVCVWSPGLIIGLWHPSEADCGITDPIGVDRKKERDDEILAAFQQ